MNDKKKLHNQIYCLLKNSQKVFKIPTTRVVAQLIPATERLAHLLETSWCHVNFVNGNNDSSYEIFS